MAYTFEALLRWLMLIPLFAEHGFLTPEPVRTPSLLSPGSSGSSDEGTIWGTVFWLIVVFLFCVYRSNKKGVKLPEYVSQKYIRLNNLVNSAEIIKTAVDDYNASAADGSSRASHTKSEVFGGFVAVRDDQGNLLSEVPSKRIGAWFWIVVTVFLVSVLT